MKLRASLIRLHDAPMVEIFDLDHDGVRLGVLSFWFQTRRSAPCRSLSEQFRQHGLVIRCSPNQAAPRL